MIPSASSAFLIPATERRIGLRQVESPAQAIAGVRNVAALCARWGESEFRVFRTPAMEFSTRRLESGCSLKFYSKQGQGQALVEDGSLELTVQPKSGSDADVVVRAVGRGADASARGRQLDLLYRLLLDDVRAGLMGGELAPFALHPPTADVARLRKKIAAACLYNKEGQYRRF